MCSSDLALAEALPDLVTSLVEEDVDARIGVVRCDVWGRTDGGALLGSVDVGDASAGDTLAALVPTAGDGPERQPCLLAATLAVTAPMIDTTNAGFLRDDTPLRVVAVAADDDCSAADADASCPVAADDVATVDSLLGALDAADADGLTVSALASGSGCDTTSQRYAAAVDATDGVFADLCADDVDTFLWAALGPAVPRYTTFTLSSAAVEDTLDVLVDDAAVLGDAEEGWTLEGAAHFLVFHGSAVPARGALVDVEYQVAGP